MENHKEDILKKFLQDTFSDYEPEPSDASWETIFSAIQPNKPTFWDKSKPWIASVLVILTGAWLWYSSATVEANNGKIAMASGRVGTFATDMGSERVETLATDAELASDLLVKTPTKAEITDARSGRVRILATDAHTKKSASDLLVKTPTKAESSQIQKNDVNDKIENKITKYSKEIIVKSATPKEEEGNHPIVERQSDEIVVSRDNLVVSTNERVEIIATDMNLLVKTPTKAELGRTPTNAEKAGSGRVGTLDTDMRDNLTASTSGRVETLATDARDNLTASTSGQVETLTTDAKNAIIEQVRYIYPLESLRNKDFMLTKIAMNSPVIAPMIMPNREAKPVRQHTYLSMSITPIQTYRILTINNNYVQNVQTNNLFDSERNGWQLDLGITKPITKLWNFRANVSYLRMRQWSEYQIGTNELILRNNNSSSNSYPSQGDSPEIEVVGQTVTESKNLHMVGLKMDVQKFFKVTTKNRYFISTGTQVMYENSQKQSNIFLNVSAGFQHIVSKTTFLTIEPTASYGLNNFNDSRSLLQANGYNLGLKMGVSFQVK